MQPYHPLGTGQEPATSPACRYPEDRTRAGDEPCLSLSCAGPGRVGSPLSRSAVEDERLGRERERGRERGTEMERGRKRRERVCCTVQAGLRFCFFFAMQCTRILHT